MHSMKTFVVAASMSAGLALGAIAQATQCPDLVVKVQNSTPQQVSGGVWGNTGNLGSSGYGVGAGQSADVHVYAQNYPGGDFGVVGNIQWYGSSYTYVNCVTTVRQVKGCPAPNVHPTMTTYDNGAGAQCAWSRK
jgi:hypothetical protein